VTTIRYLLACGFGSVDWEDDSRKMTRRVQKEIDVPLAATAALAGARLRAASTANANRGRHDLPVGQV
jgi:hypothetical protein